MKRFFVMLGLVFVLGVVSASAQPQGSDPPQEPLITQPDATGQNETQSILAKVGDVLLIFLVLAVVFEVALAPIFNWRFFLARFDGKGWKTPITVLLAFGVFWKYDLDIINELLVAMNVKTVSIKPGDFTLKPGDFTLGGQALTALLIAGGSSGIFQIFSKLGIRNPTETKIKAVEAQAALALKKAEAELAAKKAEAEFNDEN